MGCHSSKHVGYSKGGNPPQQHPQSSGHFQTTKEVAADLRVATFMNQKGITPDQTLNLLGNYYGGEGTQEWPAEEESVNKACVEIGF